MIFIIFIHWTIHFFIFRIQQIFFKKKEFYFSRIHLWCLIFFCTTVKKFYCRSNAGETRRTCNFICSFILALILLPILSWMWCKHKARMALSQEKRFTGKSSAKWGKGTKNAEAFAPTTFWDLFKKRGPGKQFNCNCSCRWKRFIY